VALPEPAGPVDGYQIFENCQWNDWWDDACMKSVIYYLRASKDLELGEWRPLFPTEL
jgi:hypothetical protein